MLYTIPDYYHEFTCVAGKCEDTCCAGWQIVADEASLEKYKNETGTFAERLKESVNWEEGTFKQDKDRRCAFLNQSNLCDMYTALGEESPVSYTHLRAHETDSYLVCRLLLEKKKTDKPN